MSNSDIVIGKFYTKTRRIQTYVGKLPGGSYIIGGPYTQTQVIVFTISLILLSVSRRLNIWGGNILLDIGIILIISLSMVFLVNLIPVNRRPLLSMIDGYFETLFRSSTGKYKGKNMPKSFNYSARKKLKNFNENSMKVNSEETVSKNTNKFDISETGLDILRTHCNSVN